MTIAIRLALAPQTSRLRLSLWLLTLALAAAASVSLPLRPRAHGSFEAMTVAGMRRTYWLQTPRGTGGRLPTVILLHGGTGYGRQVARYTRFDTYAAREGFLLVCPDGTGKHWNDGRGTVVGGKAPTVDDVAFISALIDHCVQSGQADPKRVYIAGISNGAIFAYRLGAELAPKIAAIAAVSGAIAEPLAAHYRPAVPVSLVAFNGTADPLVPFKGGAMPLHGGRVLSANESVRRWVAADGTPNDPTTWMLPHRVKSDPTRVTVTGWPIIRGVNAEIVQYTITGGGHGWPVGIPMRRLTGRLAGDVDATTLICDFFRRHYKGEERNPGAGRASPQDSHAPPRNG